LAVWHSGSIIRVMLNEDTLCRAQLVLGWVTIFRQVYHLGMCVTKPTRLTQPRFNWLAERQECHLCRVTGNTVIT